MSRFMFCPCISFSCVLTVHSSLGGSTICGCTIFYLGSETTLAIARNGTLTFVGLVCKDEYLQQRICGDVGEVQARHSIDVDGAWKVVSDELHLQSRRSDEARARERKFVGWKEDKSASTPRSDIYGPVCTYWPLSLSLQKRIKPQKPGTC